MTDNQNLDGRTSFVANKCHVISRKKNFEGINAAKNTRKQTETGSREPKHDVSTRFNFYLIHEWSKKWK